MPACHAVRQLSVSQPDHNNMYQRRKPLPTHTETKPSKMARAIRNTAHVLLPTQNQLRNKLGTVAMQQPLITFSALYIQVRT